METLATLKNPLTTGLSTLWLPTPVTLATLSLESVTGSVKIWVEGNGVSQLQLVKVSSVTLTENPS